MNFHLKLARVKGESSTGGGRPSGEGQGLGVGRLRWGCTVYEAPPMVWANSGDGVGELRRRRWRARRVREWGRAPVGRRELHGAAGIYREREGRGEVAGERDRRPAVLQGY
jgi:hypothetical protein